MRNPGSLYPIRASHPSVPSLAGKQVVHGVLHCVNAMSPKRLHGTRCLKCRQGIVQAAGSVVTPEEHSAPLCANAGGDTFNVVEAITKAPSWRGVESLPGL
jgi:hypothetical protein